MNANELRAKAIGEGANLGVTEAGRIEFAEQGGRINTDFIDNSAGVDCSDNEVNIKIPLNREMREGQLDFSRRNALLSKMTDDVADIVLEDNRLQSLALSIAESGGALVLPSYVRTIELLEATGRLDRKVEGLGRSEELLRRAQDNRGLTRPELAVVLSVSKLVLQGAAEDLRLAETQSSSRSCSTRFRERCARPTQRPSALIGCATRSSDEGREPAGEPARPGCRIRPHRGGRRLLQQVVAAFLVAERLLDLDKLWREIEESALTESVRIELFAIAATSIRSHIADVLRAGCGETSVAKLCALLEPGVRKISAAAARLIRSEVKNEAAARRDRLIALGASDDIVRGLVRLYEIDGIFGVAALAARNKLDELATTRSYTRLGEALGLDWAQQQVARFVPADQWERLLTAGLTRDFEQLRIEFLAHCGTVEVDSCVEQWVEKHAERIGQFRDLIARARNEAHVSAPMLAQIAAQARLLLGR